MILSARGDRKTSPHRPSSPPRRPGTAGAATGNQPWVPPGKGPHSPPRQLMPGAMTGTRRNRAIEHTHLFLDKPELPPEDPANFFWLYGAFDFKMQCPMEQAQATVFKTIDRLVERMNRHAPQQQLGSPNQGSGPGFGSADFSRLGSAKSTGTFVGRPQPGQMGGKGGTLSMAAAGNNTTTRRGLPGDDEDEGKNKVNPPPLKAHLIFDIISTKKHLGSVPTLGLPYKLGTEIYEYVDKEHGVQIVTTFVGLTDNTARRPGRDVYYTQSEELSKNRLPFSELDRVHMFVVFPGPPPLPEEDKKKTAQKKTALRVGSAGRRR